jgi:hypothetical protein
MRPIITILIAIFLLAGIYAYTDFANRVRPETVEYQADFSDSKYTVRVNRTFDCMGNAEFGLPQALGLVFKQEDVINREDRVPASETIEVDLPGVEIGRNIIEVVANLPNELAMNFDENGESGFDSFEAKSDAMQVVLMRDGNEIAKETFWVEPGLNSVSGSLYFEIEKLRDEEDEQ